MTERTLNLSEQIDVRLIIDGYPAECVTWVCQKHHRHCERIDTDHIEHACIWCADNA